MGKGHFLSGTGQSSRGKDLLARGNIFPLWPCSILSGIRPFVWDREAFRWRNDPLPREKDVFLVPLRNSASKKSLVSRKSPLTICPGAEVAGKALSWPRLTSILF